MLQRQRIGGLPQADLRNRLRHRPTACRPAASATCPASGGTKTGAPPGIQQAIAVGVHQFALGRGGEAARAGQALALRRFRPGRTPRPEWQNRSCRRSASDAGLRQVDHRGRCHGPSTATAPRPSARHIRRRPRLRGETRWSRALAMLFATTCISRIRPGLAGQRGISGGVHA